MAAVATRSLPMVLGLLAGSALVRPAEALGALSAAARTARVPSALLRRGARGGARGAASASAAAGGAPQGAAAAAAPAEAAADGPTPAKGLEELGTDMNEIVSLCKRRGIVYPSSDIYSGFNGFYDYGPLGVELRANIKKAWWQDMVHRREDVVGLDSSIIASPRIWEASGHVAGFSDPMVDCKSSKQRFRADQLFYAPVSAPEGSEGAPEGGKPVGYVSLLESGDMEGDAAKAAKAVCKKAGVKLPPHTRPVVGELRDVTHASAEELALIPSPATGEVGTLTPPRDFNLMFQTSVGALADASAVAYLRPETAQGIFTNFKNVASTSRVKVPFGIAQIGKAFRNEITPRNFIFRSREFEQMELEYFFKPNAEDPDSADGGWRALHADWVQSRFEWHVGIGVRRELLSIEAHADDKLAHYAQACSDIMFKFPFGVQELEGCAARGCYDLTQHMEASGKSLEWVDEATKEKFVPHVIEPSVGVDRCMLALICSAYAEDSVGGEKRTLLRFHPRIAPIKAAVFPLVKNNAELVGRARELFERLQRRYNVAFDAAGNIGRRYRRMDEAGTPFCVTVDFDTLEDGTVTLRERDSTAQRRMSIDEVVAYISDAVDG